MSSKTQSNEDLRNKVNELDEKVRAIAEGLSALVALASTIQTSDQRDHADEEVKRLRKVNAALLNVIKELVADE